MQEFKIREKPGSWKRTAKKHEELSARQRNGQRRSQRSHFRFETGKNGFVCDETLVKGRIEGRYSVESDGESPNRAD
jgi:hypothetical protein